MEFLIADSFSDSLTRLTGEEQKAVKTTAFDLQINPASPGMSFHKLDKARDKKFWSVRVSRDIRLIVHKTDSSLLMCFAGHHDAAYDWAERRRLERHPKTGAAQLVEVRETVLKIKVPRYVENPAETPAMAPKPVLFKDVSDEELLSYGVPEEWIEDVRMATEETLLNLAEHLPAEASEALLELATGSKPQRPIQTGEDEDPFAHPDAKRRFRVMADIEELERAFEYPWDKWMVFLHPTQRQIVERDYNGPARVAGSAGTGKSIVALHRAVHLARTNPDARVLLVTFSETLAGALQILLRRLIGNTPVIGERLEVHSMLSIGKRLYEANFGRVQLVSDERVKELISETSINIEHKFSSYFLWTEWTHVVDSWQLKTWDDYRDVKRLGRKTRLAEKQRAILWEIFLKVNSAITDAGLLTEPRMFTCLEEKLATAKNPPFDFAVVDEAQDIGVAQLRFISALGGRRSNSLFFAGDLGQRIFQTPFSWKSLGVDVRGRSQILRLNYRTSHQILQQADRLLPENISDVDGNTEGRRGTVSVFNGPEPCVKVFKSVALEFAAIKAWIKERVSQGLAPHEIGVFVRSQAQMARGLTAVKASGLSYVELSTHPIGASGSVSVGTMHLAKGLEFRAVVVAACDDEIIPLQSRIESVVDTADLEDVYDTERHLLYVACTRARDYLMVTGVDPASDFIDDLRNN